VRIVGAHPRRASQAIARKIPEGNGTATSADRRGGCGKAPEARRWSARRVRTCLLVCEALCADDNSKQRALLDRPVATLTKLGQGGYALSEELGGWVGRFDTDADSGTE
jgi:hypothetical protein